METNKITKTEIKEFQNYCLGFYGKNGIYSDELKGGVSSKFMSKAIQIYLITLTSTEKSYEISNRVWGGGDSLDRERVRGILEVLI